MHVSLGQDNQEIKGAAARDAVPNFGTAEVPQGKISGPSAFLPSFIVQRADNTALKIGAQRAPLEECGGGEPRIPLGD
jgi:hypothetical protein